MSVVLLPAATPSIVVGSCCDIGRALAETAALLFTSGYVDRMPETLLDSGARPVDAHLRRRDERPGRLAERVGDGPRVVMLLLTINVATLGIVAWWRHRRTTR